MADTPMIQLDETDFIGDDDQELDVNKDADKQEPAPSEPSTEENKDPEVADEPAPDEGGKQPEGKPTPAKEGEPEGEQPPAEEGEDKQPQGRLEQRKDQLTQEIEEGKQNLGIPANTEIRDLVSAQRAIREAVQARNQQVYAPQTPEEVMAETGQDETNARLTAMEQQRDLDNWNSRVSEAQLVVGTDSQRVLQDFPIFNPTLPDGQANPQYQPQIAAQAADVLERNLIRDPNVPELNQSGQPTGKGMIVGFHATPYQIYKPIADAHAASAAQGRVTAQRDAEKMLANAEPASSAPPKAPKEDPFLSGLTGGLRK